MAKRNFEETLYRKYNKAIEEGGNIPANLEELLFGYQETIKPPRETLEQELLRKAGEIGRNGEACGAGRPTSFPPVDSMGAAKRILDASPGESPDNRILGGYDGGFETGFMGSWDSEKHSRLVDYLESERKDGSKTIVELEGREFLLYPHGGGENVHYRYILEGGGLKLYIHHKAGTGIQPIRFRLGFEALNGRSLCNVHRETLDFLEELGFSPGDETITNVDLQCMFERPANEYIDLIAARWCVKRFRKSCGHEDGEYRNSFNGGCGLKIRIYDKTKELLDNQDNIKSRLLAEACLGGHIPDVLTRIEFSINRETLAEAQINTLEDLMDYEESLVEYLTHRWFRLLDGPKSKGNEKRQAVHPIWKEVQERFAEYFNGADAMAKKELTRRENIPKCTADADLKQAVGVIASMTAKCCGNLSSFEEIMAYFKDRAEEFSETLVKKVRQRAHMLAVRIGCKIEDIGDYVGNHVVCNGRLLFSSREAEEFLHENGFVEFGMNGEWIHG